MGVNINPFVVVKVGEEKRHTATQKSTNCPFYNEVCDMDRDPVLAPLVSRVTGTILAKDAWKPGAQLSCSSLSVLFV